MELHADTFEEAQHLIKHWQDKGYTVEYSMENFSFKIMEPPVSEVENLSGEGPTGMLKSVNNLLQTMGVKIKHTENLGEANGRTYKTLLSRNTVVEINSNTDRAQQIKTLVHEIAHIKLGHADMGFKKSIEQSSRNEIAAEAVAYIVCKKFGFDTSRYSHPYIAEWSFGEKQKVREIVKEKALPLAKEILEQL